MPPLRRTGPVPEHQGAADAPEAEHPQYAGRYRLEECLGSGGMGVVHLARSGSGLRLAVKVVHAEHAADPEFRARFRQEVAAARRVSGAFTAPVVDADPDAARPWMATLFIDGPTLSERVKRNGPLGAAELRGAGAGLAEALRDIHRAGVVHRDLKPSNVLLAADGPKVIDFGISRPADSDLRTETGKLIGTPPFMAPEQFQRPREVGPAADVFAMGAVLVHAATGRGPFDSHSPYVVAYQVVHNEPDLAGVPEHLVPLLRRCLAKDPAERPTADEVLGELRAGEPSAAVGPGAVVGPGAPVGPGAAVAGGTSRTAHTSRATSTPRPSAAPSRRRPRLRWAAGLTVLAAVVTGGVVGVSGMADDPATRTVRAQQDGTVSTFRPWSVALGTAGGENRTPLCAAPAGPTDASAPTALYCTAPGVKAARVRPTDGSTAWLIPTDATDATASTDATEAPVLSGGLVHVVAPGRARLEALAPETGATRWSRNVSAYATVLHAGDTVLLVAADGAVRALDGATGDERWRGRFAARGAQWVAGRDAVYAATASPDGASTLVRAVDPADGRVRWTKRTSGALSPVQASEDGLLLLSTDADLYTDAVVTLDADGRAVRRVPLTVRADQAQAVRAGDTVYVIGSGGSLAAVDTGRAAGGAGQAQRWRLETAVTRASRPVVSGGHLYLAAADGRLLAVDAGRGVLLGMTKPRMDGGRYTFAPLLPAPAVANGTVFATAPDGSVFAVAAKDPTRW
ncbi:protein kinase domain-containing protein [Streptomyces ficellus]|uniref:Serine/threonine-protein kinase n=1 Tax=Streptomyces ficellus TaxID=1977088 RepID=A0A6I6F6F7_9ACTN|nr:serine/threonine-protein kinase [Streptomyces ficellus]QGV79240.1 serine/threonine-protein kinase [Streptomyces ficellus]